MKPKLMNNTATAADSITNFESSILKAFTYSKPKSPIELREEITQAFSPTLRHRLKKWWRRRRMERWAKWFEARQENRDFRTILVAVAGWIATVEKKVLVNQDEWDNIKDAIALAAAMHRQYKGDHALFLEAHARLVGPLSKLYPGEEFETFAQ